MNTAQLKKEYKENIAPALQKQFNYTSAMQGGSYLFKEGYR